MSPLLNGAVYLLSVARILYKQTVVETHLNANSGNGKLQLNITSIWTVLFFSPKQTKNKQTKSLRVLDKVRVCASKSVKWLKRNIYIKNSLNSHRQSNATTLSKTNVKYLQTPTEYLRIQTNNQL